MFTEDEHLDHIPARFRRPCALHCGHDLDIREAGTHQWTAGWVKLRQGGGGHGISLPVREDRWAHGWCVERAVKGWEKAQGSLFG